MLALSAHPETPSTAVRSVRAGASRTEGRIAVHYRIEGEVARLRIPPQCPPAPAERLWQHTCCEIFIARPDAPGYQEFNFSPSGEWAAYAFAAYRDGAPWQVPDPRIAVRRRADALELEAMVHVEPVGLRVALCVVIEDAEGALSYWALRHPSGKPDFHHPHGFALELA